MIDKICLILTILLGIGGVYMWFATGKPKDRADKAQQIATLMGGVAIIIMSLVIMMHPDY